MNSICIIPARGGSKRIPQKNIRPFLGKPVIQYSVESAIKSGLFDMVMVSTDDEQIAATAIAAGAEVPFLRSAETAGDTAGTAEVLIEVLNQFSKQGKQPGTACCLYAAAPFVNAKLLQEAHELFTRENFDTVFPVQAFDYPVQRGLLVRNGEVAMREPEHLNTRSQDLEKVYHDTGMFYFFKTAPLLATGHLWKGRTGVIKLTAMQAQDIDTPEDWEVAEWKYRYMQEKEG